MNLRPERRRRRSTARFVRSALLGAGLVAAIVLVVNHFAAPTMQPPVKVAAVVHRVSPAVVDVNSTLGIEDGAAAGTGMVLTSNGEVLTNNHVVDGATSVQVVVPATGRTYTAAVIGYSEKNDVAVLQLPDASGMSTVSLGDSGSVSVGDSVAAFGNAGGVGGQPSIVTGHVTAVGQSITAFDDVNSTSENLTGLIQTNAQIEPGDSGGPLVNAQGLVIGMDTAAASSGHFNTPDDTAGFAIPINKAMAIASQIVAGQASSSVHIGPTAFLGITIMSPSNSTIPGVEIDQTLSGYPAQRELGLQSGDIITSINGVSVSDGTQLSDEIALMHPGQTVSLGWIDQNGQAHRQPVTLATGPSA